MIKHGEDNRGGKTKTILAVDDEPSVLESYSYCLGDDYDFILASSGEEALEELSHRKVDLVLLDIMMPGMDGIETLRRIKEIDSDLGVIMATVRKDSESYDVCMKLGASDYICKPFQADELLRSIERLLYTSSVELEARRLKSLASILAEENERLKERIEQLSQERQDRAASEELDRYKAICGAVSHSLKSEFLHIGYSIKELRELANTSPDMQEECDIVERSVAYSHIFLQRLLDYLDMGKPRVELIDALELLRKAELLAKPRLPSSIKLQVTVDHSMKERTVSTNLEQLMGVLLELINNATNVLREKGGTIELKLGGRNGEIGISVEDNGPGIPEDFKEKLLKEQVSSKSGLGLGLFLCNKVVSALGGELNLENTSGEGTTFTVLLPMASDQKEP